ncbi:MAG: hypothetical protein QW128_08125 [Thermoprotei archaeon]
MQKTKNRVTKTLNHKFQVKPLTDINGIIGWTVNTFAQAKDFVAEKLKKRGNIKYIMVDETVIREKQVVRGEIICVSEKEHRIIASAIIYAHYNGNVDLIIEYY